MRYFRWGVSRLLLEPAIQPSLVPMFITGFSDIMHESRSFPRFLPRVGKNVTLHIGEVVPDSRFLDLRSKWHDLKHQYRDDEEYLKTGEKVVELRIETTGRVREEVAKLRRRVGFLEEDEGAGKVETYRLQGMGMREGKLADGTWEKDT
jgi:monolysocardiolipin acyltransferase